jgi:hypothetical protein
MNLTASKFTGAVSLYHSMLITRKACGAYNNLKSVKVENRHRDDPHR